MTKNVFLVTLKAKYPNVPIISEFCHMSWVTGSLLANLISKNFCIVLYETPCRRPRILSTYILLLLNVSDMDEILLVYLLHLISLVRFIYMIHMQYIMLGNIPNASTLPSLLPPSLAFHYFFIIAWIGITIR